MLFHFFPIRQSIDVTVLDQFESATLRLAQRKDLIAGLNLVFLGP